MLPAFNPHAHIDGGAFSRKKRKTQQTQLIKAIKLNRVQKK